MMVAGAINNYVEVGDAVCMAMTTGQAEELSHIELWNSAGAGEVVCQADNEILADSLQPIAVIYQNKWLVKR